MWFPKILARIVLISILVLVSKPEIEKRNSRSRLEARDWEKEILVLVSNMRLKERNSRSRLENWNRLLVTLWLFRISLKSVVFGKYLNNEVWIFLPFLLSLFFLIRFVGLSLLEQCGVWEVFEGWDWVWMCQVYPSFTLRFLLLSNTAKI